jgi:hypothetical protein
MKRKTSHLSATTIALLSGKLLPLMITYREGEQHVGIGILSLRNDKTKTLIVDLDWLVQVQPADSGNGHDILTRKNELVAIRGTLRERYEMEFDYPHLIHDQEDGWITIGSVENTVIKVSDKTEHLKMIRNIRSKYI